MVFRWFLTNCFQSTNYNRYNCNFDIPQLCTFNLKPWYLLISSSSFMLMFWCYDDYALSPLIINDYNIWPSVFYFLFCLDCKVPRYLTFVIFQQWLWLMQELFVFTFNLKLLAQNPMCIFTKFVISDLVLVSS